MGGNMLRSLRKINARVRGGRPTVTKDQMMATRGPVRPPPTEGGIRPTRGPVKKSSR